MSKDKITLKEIETEEKITSQEIQQAKEITKLALEQPITQESELKGVLKVINEDEIEIKTGFPSIDLKGRIMSPYEKTAFTVHDTIIHLNCLPTLCLVTTRKALRLSVSLKGMGREEAVRIVQGEREKQSAGSFGERLKNLFVPQQ